MRDIYPIIFLTMAFWLALMGDFLFIRLFIVPLSYNGPRILLRITINIFKTAVSVFMVVLSLVFVGKLIERISGKKLRLLSILLRQGSRPS